VAATVRISVEVAPLSIDSEPSHDIWDAHQVVESRFEMS
jgi:hypothetical protein